MTDEQILKRAERAFNRYFGAVRKVAPKVAGTWGNINWLVLDQTIKDIWIAFVTPEPDLPKPIKCGGKPVVTIGATDVPKLTCTACDRKWQGDYPYTLQCFIDARNRIDKEGHYL